MSLFSEQYFLDISLHKELQFLRPNLRKKIFSKVIHFSTILITEVKNKIRESYSNTHLDGRFGQGELPGEVAAAAPGQVVLAAVLLLEPEQLLPRKGRAVAPVVGRLQRRLRGLVGHLGAVAVLQGWTVAMAGRVAHVVLVRRWRGQASAGLVLVLVLGYSSLVADHCDTQLRTVHRTHGQYWINNF